jgi:hypothetical protein
MSSWITLNIDGVDPDKLPEAFEDWWVYEQDGLTVAYSFRPTMSTEEAVDEIVKVGEHPCESAVKSVVVLKCQDTADFVQATKYRPRGVKWNGAKAVREWAGHHGFREEDSEFLNATPDEIKPIFGGNWTDE